MLEIDVGPNLSSQQAEAICDQGKAAVVFALLAMARRLAEQQAAEAASSHQTPATPSGMKPPDAKPPASRCGKKKPGRKAGHPGSRRAVPEHIDWQAEHRAERTIRPAVTLRKNSDGNRSGRGAGCQAVLMSIFRTLKQRGHDPIGTASSAYRTNWARARRYGRTSL